MATVVTTCKKCGEDAEHGVRPNGKPLGYCRPCQRAYARNHYAENRPEYLNRRKARVPEEREQRRTLIQAAKDKPCADCEIRYPYYVMQFDHVRGEKDFNISDANSASPSLARLLAEIAKCDVVCANCHAARTHLRG